MGKHKNGVYVLSTWDIIRGWFSKKQAFKNKQDIMTNAVPPPPGGAVITNLAVVLDGQVEEIIRAQGMFASLLLNQPKFYEFQEDNIDRPYIGWKYLDGVFIRPGTILNEIEDQIDSEGKDTANIEEIIEQSYLNGDTDD
jgi:hypothetical protein